MAVAGRIRRLVLSLLLAVTIPAVAIAQEGETRRDPNRTHFASFDVGFGGLKPVDADWGLSYGVAFDVANLLIKGASLRFGFRFWTAESEQADGRTVDLDDSVFDIMVKKQLGSDALGAYAGLGLGLHVINARFRDRIDEKEDRDGVNVGLDGVLGVQKSLADRGFISLFVEALGSLMSEASHAALHVGIRIRFDRL